jgi:DNA-binding transcriptional ArsR family regulator
MSADQRGTRDVPRGSRSEAELASAGVTAKASCGIVDTYPYRYIIVESMARAATTADVFNAVAEPRRREILDLLAAGERPVNDLVGELRLGQPQVSKHLRVLREVGAVGVRHAGRRRLYRLNGHALKPIHDWVKSYEDLWTERFRSLDVVVEELKREEQEEDGGGE